MPEKKVKLLPLEKILFSQGFGTRKYCSQLVLADLVKVNGQGIRDPDELLEPNGLLLEVEGQPWLYQENAYLVLHKPLHVECSHKTKHYPSVFTLLPQPLIERDVQCVGRLDQDTTGLLLLSDDGQFIHQMTSPKKNIGKLYQIQTASRITPSQIEHLLNGVVLDDNPQPCFATQCTLEGERQLAMTIVEGRYHQVKRMLAAVGNHVEALHRRAIGQFFLPQDLHLGEWRWLTAENKEQLRSK